MTEPPPKKRKKTVKSLTLGKGEIGRVATGSAAMVKYIHRAVPKIYKAAWKEDRSIPFDHFRPRSRPIVHVP